MAAALDPWWFPCLSTYPRRFFSLFFSRLLYFFSMLFRSLSIASSSSELLSSALFPSMRTLGALPKELRSLPSIPRLPPFPSPRVSPPPLVCEPAAEDPFVLSSGSPNIPRENLSRSLNTSTPGWMSYGSSSSGLPPSSVRQ